MRIESIKTLESLSLVCHAYGLVSIILGICVIAMDAINSDFGHIQVGFFITITGYSFVKIAAKISRVLAVERNVY